MLEQELILDRYRVIGKAGSGGYATVQHAFDTHLKRDVAIKCIRITRADVDAAKRTAALLRQIDRPPEVSIPIGSSRVIPVGGSAAARIHRESTRSVYRRHRSGQPAFGSVEGVRANVLPQEPGFLSKREERLRRGKDRKSNRGTAFDPLPDRTQDIPAEVPPEEEIIEEPRISRPREIPSLVDMLPGAISGAGETKISGVDSDALSINLDLEELLSRTEGRGQKAPASELDSGAGAKKALSFLDAMDAEERARWQGQGDAGQDDIYHRNLALGGVRETAPLGEAPPSITAVAQWQASAQHQQRREQAFRSRNVRRANMPSPSSPASTALSSVELAQLDTVPGLEEARTAAHLNDANIVTVYDCVVEGDMAYVIMEYVEGKTLARIIRELGDDITLDMVSAVFSGVSHALEVAHKSNVLHLDIKPENVVVNKEGTVKVTDFGLSTLMNESGQGKTGGGTIGYMPLEQMRRQPLDVRTDEWALASLTYEMLSGSNPFRANTLAEAEMVIEDAEIVLPSRCWDGMSEAVDDIMFTALSPDADGRFDTIAEFSKALTPNLGSAKEGIKQLSRAVATLPAAATSDTAEESEEGAGGRGGFFAGLFGGRGKAEAAGAAGVMDAEAGSSVAQGARAGQPVRDDDRGREEREDRSERTEREQRAPRPPREPFIDRLGERGAGWVKRVVAGISAAMISAVGLLNFRMQFGEGTTPAGTQDTTFGLFSTVPLAAVIVLLLLMVLAVLKPRVGFLGAYGAFALSLMFSQAWTCALLLVIGLGAWWWFAGRRSDGSCTLVMMTPLLGSVGFAAVVPVVAGAVMDVREALAASAGSIVSAIVFAALGSHSLANWEVYANFIVAVNPVIAGAVITNGLNETLASAGTWVVAGSWLMGAGAFSLFCLRGTKAFDIVGSVVCGAIIICGMLVLPPLVGVQNGLMPLSVAGALVPALVGVVFAVANVTDRVRMAEGEW